MAPAEPADDTDGNDQQPRHPDDGSVCGGFGKLMLDIQINGQEQQFEVVGRRLDLSRQLGSPVSYRTGKRALKKIRRLQQHQVTGRRYPVSGVVLDPHRSFVSHAQSAGYRRICKKQNDRQRNRR